MKKNLLFIGMGFLLIGASIFSACTKEGPTGADGKDGVDGKNGTNGVDGSTKCQECHSPTYVGLAATQYDFSKHSYGEAAFEESGNTGCSPCHASQAFLYVVKNNVSAAFKPSTTPGRWTNGYASIASQSIGHIACETCHSSLHTTYGKADISPLTTVAAVPMTFFGGAQTINLAADGGKGNLCVKCHQPRPFSNSNTNGNVLNYDSLKNFPTVIFYDSARADGLNRLKPGYRTHTHYGTVGAIYAGMGKAGVEFAGTETYANSVHTTGASCQDCHMATQEARSGGHTFRVRNGEGALTSTVTFNFNGCNATGCHTGVNSSSVSYWTAPRADIKAKLDALAAKLKYNGMEILNRNPNTNEALGGVNLWAGITTNNYDGYLNIYDPINNPNGFTNNPGGTFKNPGSTSGWSAAQIATNNGLKRLVLTNAQMGALINFQLCLREYSLGIHNYKYTKALLVNTTAAL